MKNFKSGQYINQGYYKSFQPNFINKEWLMDDMQVIGLLSKADRQLGRLDMYSEYVNIDLFIRMHIAKEATQSSKIEGTQTNMEEAFLDKKDINLTVIGEEENSISDINYENIEILKIVKDQKKLIKCYDNHNIFILPSFTEGQPMALLEALSRLRPVVVFKEIEHVKQGREGIFVSNRNYNDLIKNVNYILQNYNSIQEKMKKNHLPTREQFIQNLKDIINKEVSV